MMGWILDLIFNNIWFVILLFWVFRLFSKGFKEGTRKSPQPRQKRNKPRDVNWETDFEEVRQPIVPTVREEITQEKKMKPSHTEKQFVNSDKTKAEQAVPPSPVQGMMWSQIYGPPRSKNPHYSRKTR